MTGSLWGAPTPVSGTLSLAQIQQQEERERKQRELQLQQQLQAQQREQQSRGMPGWGDRPPPTNQPVKSLLQIQQEQARQLDKRQQGPVLSRSQVIALFFFFFHLGELDYSSWCFSKSSVALTCLRMSSTKLLDCKQLRISF